MGKILTKTSYLRIFNQSDVSNRKNEKTTINYLKREGSKFPVRRGNEWIWKHYKHFRLFHILWFEVIYDVNLASMPKSQIYQRIKAKYEDLKRTFKVIKSDIFAKLIWPKLFCGNSANIQMCREFWRVLVKLTDFSFVL